MDLTERIAQTIREWPQWSRVERSRMETDLIPEIMDHVRNGTGNKFIASWCERVLSPVLIAHWTDSAIAKLRAYIGKRHEAKRVGALGSKLIAQLETMPGSEKDKRESRERIGAFMRVYC